MPGAAQHPAGPAQLGAAGRDHDEAHVGAAPLQLHVALGQVQADSGEQVVRALRERLRKSPGDVPATQWLVSLLGEAIGYSLTLVAELNLNDIKGESAPSLDAWRRFGGG